MTPEAAVAAVRKAKHIVIVHRGHAFFNTHDYDEALKWEKQGARIVPHYDLEGLERRRKKGMHPVPGWEVHLLGACDKEWTEDENGDQVDITNDVLLAAARAKVTV